MIKFDLEQKNRFLQLLKNCGILLAVCIVYLLFVKFTGISIPCLFYLITDKYCPGCGITRMFVDIFRLDFPAALSHNAFVFCILPIGAFLFVYKAWTYIKSGNTDTKVWENILYIILSVFCFAFFILRNLNGFEYLQP